jgi:ferredoxin-NADP reductase
VTGSPTADLVERELEVLVDATRVAADDVVELRLTSAGAESLPTWAAGAHIDLVLGDDMVRQYSLCGDPEDRDSWQVAVLREPDGRGGSAAVHDRVRPGDRLRVRGPRNHFELVPAAAYLLIAGGIGLTPLLAMARTLERQGANWQMLYGGRRRASMAYLAELARFGDRVTVQPEDENGLLDLDAWLSTPRPDTAVYCCGPEPLLEAVELRCTGWPVGALHIERFHARPGALDGPDEAFEVVLDASGLTVTVDAGQSIVDAVAAVGVDVPTSCREGTCGTCETVVLEGEPDHRDSFLSPSERAANETMLVCCSRSHGPRLVLDL